MIVVGGAAWLSAACQDRKETFVADVDGSLSAVEPVSAPPKRKLENSHQRPEPETRPARAEMPEIADQRLGHPSLTCGNVGDSPPPGNNTPETGLAGCPKRIRTWKCNVELSFVADVGTALCLLSNRSLHPRNGNWKIATRDRSQKPAPQEPKCQKVRTRDWGTPA